MLATAHFIHSIILLVLQLHGINHRKQTCILTFSTNILIIFKMIQSERK